MSRISVVTGASRGVGKGIAEALGACGDTVYITGRSALDETSELINRAGGRAVPAICDHADDEQIKALFERIDREHGRLDILVNNAAAVSKELARHEPFWELSTELIDSMNVGVRSSYMASYFAAPLLIKSKAGLLVNTSGFGGGCYLHGPAYGASKTATDRLAIDMGIEFKPYNVCAVSLWMGLMKTETVQSLCEEFPHTWGQRQGEMESPQFVGRVIDALQRAPDRMARSAKVWIATELGHVLGVRENDGSAPVSKRNKFGGPVLFNAPVLHR